MTKVESQTSGIFTTWKTECILQPTSEYLLELLQSTPQLQAEISDLGTNDLFFNHLSFYSSDTEASQCLSAELQ